MAACESVLDCNPDPDDIQFECVFDSDSSEGVCDCPPIFLWEGRDTGCNTPSTLLQLDRVILFFSVFITGFVLIHFISMLKDSLKLSYSSRILDGKFLFQVSIQLLATIFYFSSLVVFLVEAFEPDRFILKDLAGYFEDLVVTELTIPAYQLLAFMVVSSLFSMLSTVMSWFNVLKNINGPNVKQERRLVVFLRIFIPVASLIFVFIVLFKQVIALLIFIPVTGIVVVGIYSYMARAFTRPFIELKSNRQASSADSTYFDKSFRFFQKSNRIFISLYILLFANMLTLLIILLAYLNRRHSDIQAYAFFRITMFMLATTYFCAISWYTRTLLENYRSSSR